MEQEPHLRTLQQPTAPINGSGTAPADSTIARMVEVERFRLLRDERLERVDIRHASRPVERPFTRSEREGTTILFGGLTRSHETLIQAMMEGLGYRAESLPTPTVKSYHIGREFCNTGQCNPTYFTVGNLIQHLQSLETSGMSRERICSTHVFFTAGACGPCRFGMYEAEYRMALRNAGFGDFRVLILQQTGGLNQAEDAAGLEMNFDFTLGMLNAFIIGDILNDVAYALRPYERVPGATDSALRESVGIMREAIRVRTHFRLVDASPLLRAVARMGTNGLVAAKFLSQVLGRDTVHALRRCREVFARVRVDRSRVKPVVKITGEFWAQTTEGDGNFRMFRFLEEEGAQVMIEPIAGWLLYLMHQEKQAIGDRATLRRTSAAAGRPAWRQALAERALSARKKAVITLAERVFAREYRRLRKAMDFLPPALPDQYTLQRIAHPYYNTRLEGGEGHLEVAKTVYYCTRRLCHMVLSLKPFGCMPSTQSDGVQSAVMSHYRDVLYLPIETSGDGEINARSRVQMALGDAKARADAEMRELLDSAGPAADALLARLRSDESLADPFLRIRKHERLAGTAANALAMLLERERGTKAVTA